MTHYNEKFYDYLLGELSSEEVEAVEFHLKTCEACQRELARLSEPVVALTEALPTGELEDRVWLNLQEKFQMLTEEKAPDNITVFKPTEPARRYPWLVAACITLLVSGTSLFWGFGNFKAYQQAKAENQLLTEFLAQAQVEKVALETMLTSSSTSSPGNLLLNSNGQAVFVLASAAPQGQSYQAWGHNSGDWNPENDDKLTSLKLSERSVFKVDTTGFASLYLSLEPTGGSPQPTQPLTKVSLLAARPESPLSITSPQSGVELASNTVIVSGTVDATANRIFYRINEGNETDILSAGNRFTFTAANLQAGENKIEVTVLNEAGEQLKDHIKVWYQTQE